MLISRWQVSLFGRLRLRNHDRECVRFQTQKTGEMLAYLAYFSDRPHLRDEMSEILWPGSEPVAGRNRLKQALASLRRHLEPAGVPAGSVLVANRVQVQLNPQAIVVDIGAFRVALQAAARSTEPVEKLRHLKVAVEIHSTELLPGLNTEWIEAARRQVVTAYNEALLQLTRMYEEGGDGDKGIGYACLLADSEPWLEEVHHRLIRLYARAGKPVEAHRQYRKYARLMREGLQFAVPPYDQLVSGLSSPPFAEAACPVLSRPAHPADSRLKNAPPSMPASSSLFAAPLIPVPLTRFQGRQSELTRLCAMLERSEAHSGNTADAFKIRTSVNGAGRSQEVSQEEKVSGPTARLVNLTGPGGVGKTRLAIEAAHRVEPHFRMGLWYVPLETAAGSDDLLPLLCEAMRLPGFSTQSPLDQIAARVGAQPSLLVLDHFDAFAPDCALLKDLLDRAPNLTCLLTCRSRLDMEGERVFQVPAFPVPNGPDTPELLLTFDSVKLFVDRAQSVKPDFQLTAANAQALAAVSRALEGIPLAIEMAAAWSHSLTLGQLLERLSDRFSLLVNRKSGVAARHQSMRAVIEESCLLLPPHLLEFLTRLSNFHDEWTLTAAESLGEAPQALDYLSRLQAMSLIFAEESASGMRFHMLAILRDYLQEQNRAAKNAMRSTAKQIAQISEGIDGVFDAIGDSAKAPIHTVNPGAIFR